MNKKFVIIAPHADDEIIGCWELLQAGLVHSVMYSNKVDMNEVEVIHDFYNCKFEPFLNVRDLANDKIYLFPDPAYELHPEHRRFGMLGERLLREKNANVWFYTTNMNAPYIRESVNPKHKRAALDLAYPNKKSLWEYDHKYFLFEGYTKWIMRWDD